MTAAPALATTTPENAPELEGQALTWPERAREVSIATEADYEAAAELLTAIKALRGKIAESYDPIIKAAHRAHKEAVSAKKKVEEPLAEAEREIKGRMAAWYEEQERQRREEQRRLEEEARRREEDERLAEAEALEAAGDSDGAERALSEESPVLATAPAPPPPRAKGVAMRETWSAEVVDLMALVRAVADGTAPATLVQANTTALNGMARSLRGDMKVPGVRVRKTMNVAAGCR